MNKPLKTCLLPLFAALHGHLIAAECESVIAGACDITGSEKTGRGPLFTVQSGISGNIGVTSNVGAEHRGEAFLISGTSPQGTFTSTGNISSDYNAIRFDKSSSLKTVTLQALTSSEHDAAIKVGADATYDIKVEGSGEGERVKTNSQYHPAILIDASSTGTLTIGKTDTPTSTPTSKPTVKGSKGAIQYVGSPDRGKFRHAGEHSLVISKGSTVSATDPSPLGAALLIGSPANINISDSLPEFEFSNISINGTVDGGTGTGLALVHGVLKSSRSDPLTIEIGKDAKVTGGSTAIRLGKTGTGPNDLRKSYASFTGEIHNNGTINASKTAFLAEGDIDATFINAGTISSSSSSEETAPTIVALNLKKVTQPFTFKQTEASAKTRGNIKANPDYKTTVEVTGGSFDGKLNNIATLKMSERSTVKAKSNHFTASLKRTKGTDSTPTTITFHQKRGETIGSIREPTKKMKATVIIGDHTRSKHTPLFKGSLDVKDLTVHRNATLYLTNTSTVGQAAVINGTLAADLKTGNQPLLTAGSVTFSDHSRLVVHPTDMALEPNHPYPVLSGLKLTDSDTAVPLSISNMLLDVTGKAEVTTAIAEATEEVNKRYAYHVTLHPRPEAELRASLRQDGISNNQVRALANALKYASGQEKQLLVDAGEQEDHARLISLAGEITPHSDTTLTSLLGTSHKVATRISSRLSGTSGVSTGDFRPKGFWVQANSSEGEQDREKDDAGYKSKDKGFSVGYDMAVDDGWIDSVGIAFSPQESEISYKDSQDDLDSSLNLLTLYGEKAMSGNTVLQGQFSYGWGDNDTKRYENGVAHKASYDSSIINAQFLLKNYPSGLDIPGLALVGGLNITHVETDSYTFRGQYLNDHILKSDSTAIELGAGAEFNGTQKEGFNPHGSLMAWYDMKNDKLNTRYTVGTSPVVTVNAPDRERLSLAGELGFDYIADNITYSVDLSGIWRSGFKDTGLIGRIRFEF